MKWAIVIEKDPAVAAELKNILADVDPALVPEIFPDLQNFQVWLSETIAKKKETPTDDSMIVLMIGSTEIFNKAYFGLLCRLREFLFRRGLAVRETPPAFVLTAFDGAKSQPTNAEHEVVTNVIYKPLDRVIASQALMNALNPGKAFSLKYVYAQKSSVMIESLKDVDLFRLSEYGFTTLSDRPIEVGMITKFHHKIFVTGLRPGVYARCRSCQPNDETSGKFICHFSFYAITAEQVQSVRKFLRTQHKTTISPSFPFYSDLKTQKTSASTKTLSEEDRKAVSKMIHKEKPQTVVIVDADRLNTQKLKELLTRNFSNADVIEYNSYLEFLLEVDPSFAESKTKEKPAFPHEGAVLVTTNLTDRSILKTEPETADGAEILGHPFKSIAKKTAFLTEHAMPIDRARFTQFLASTKASAKSTVPARTEIFRFQHLAGHMCYLEFEFQNQAGATNDASVFKVREISPDERKEFLKLFRKFKGAIDTLILNESAMGPALVDRMGVIWTAMEGAKVIPEDHAPLVIAFVKEPRFHIDQNQGLHPKMTALLSQEFDRPLFLQLCALDEAGLNSIEIKKAMTYCTLNLTLKASTNVMAEELSESGIVFKYYREIKVGEFRSFHLPLEVFGKVEEESDLVELLGRSHHVVKIDEKSGYMTYFSLFGMTDVYLKHIRSWMKRHYVNAKSEEAA